jgi:enoyl-CoA hydratase/carnithine racemase
MAYQFIDVQESEGIVTLSLNRPQRRNALTLAMIEEATAALRETAVSNAWGIILRANGPIFCAGHDFDDMVARDLAGMRQLMHACAEMMQLIHEVPQPVVASVQGAAIGAGCQLALTCDLVVASDKATFRTPGGAGGWFCFTPMVAVTRAVGRKRALEMLLTGDVITADTALEWQMINRVVPHEDLVAKTQNLMARATRGSRVIRGMGKQAYYAQVDLDEAHAYAYAAEIMAATGMLPDPQERIQAFVEKRPPRLSEPPRLEIYGNGGPKEKLPGN